MTRKLTAILLTTLALGAATLPATADDNRFWRGWWGHGQMMGPGGGMMMGRFGTMDGNDDGVISDDEAAAQVELVYTAMDADEDGELTEEEYMAVRMGPGQGLNADRQKAMQERKKARFTEMDSDKSGKVGKAEFIAAGKARFEAADTNKDGKVTPWEMRAQRWH
jgi:EF hand